MPILYKSSSFETYGYYIIFPVLICTSLFFIVGIFRYGSFGFFVSIMVLIFIYVLITSTESLLKLKYIEVTENNILIKKIGGNKIIEFKDIECIYNLININGNSLVIWYKDPITQKSKVILVRPDEKNPPSKVGFPIYSYGSTELNMTKFIKDKAIKENPNYIQEYRPRWFLFSFK